MKFWLIYSCSKALNIFEKRRFILFYFSLIFLAQSDQWIQMRLSKNRNIILTWVWPKLMRSFRSSICGTFGSLSPDYFFNKSTTSFVKYRASKPTRADSSQCYKKFTGLYLQACKTGLFLKWFVATSVVYYQIIMLFYLRTWYLEVKASISILNLTTRRPVYCL